jgi:electron transport complex protein RnfB
MIPVTGDQTGWNAWSADEAKLAQKRYLSRQDRLIREESDNDQRLKRKAEKKLKALDVESATNNDQKIEIERKRAIIAAAMARAQAKQKEADQEPND